MPDLHIGTLPDPAGWNVPIGHVSWARWCLTESERFAAEVAEQSKLQGSGKLEVEPFLAKQRILREQGELRAESAVLFSAMSVEAFLNFYGVRHLGEKFFRQNLERLSPQKKLAALILATRQILIDPSSEIVTVTSQLFEIRNQLVHPKTKELIERVIRVPADEYYLVAPRNAVAKMERFFELVVTYAPDAALYIRHMESSSLTSG